MKRYFFVIIALCVPSLSAFSNTDVSSTIQERLDAEQSSLNLALSEIDSEKRVLLGQLEQVEDKLRQADRMWTIMTARNQSLGDPMLQAPLKARIESIYKGLGQLQLFNQRIPEALHPAEAKFAGERRSEKVPSMTLGDAVIATDEALEIQIRLMDETITRLENLAGGRQFEGESFLADGTCSTGSIWILGPVAFFNPREGGEVSWITSSKGNYPATAPIVPEEQAGMRAAFSGTPGKVSLPVDPEMPYQPKSGLSGKLEEVKKGGIWIVPILGFALLATVSAILKWLQLRRFKPPADVELEQILSEAGKGDRKRGLLAGCHGLVRQIVEEGIRLRESGDQKIEAKLTRAVYALHPELTRFLSFIGIAASVSPLLGLLGTVSGMIETFDVISVHGTRNAQMLSGGISEALVTTEFGLIVAIPALVLHTLLNRRIRRLMSQLEHMVRTIANIPRRECECG